MYNQKRSICTNLYNDYKKIPLYKILIYLHVSTAALDCWLFLQSVVNVVPYRLGLEVIKLEFILRIKIKCNDLLLADTC